MYVRFIQYLQSRQIKEGIQQRGKSQFCMACFTLLQSAVSSMNLLVPSPIVVRARQGLEEKWPQRSLQNPS